MVVCGLWFVVLFVLWVLVVVVVVVVVVLTVKLMTCLWRYVITDAPNYGGRVPVDTTPRPCTCVQGPKKYTPSAHQRR